MIKVMITRLSMALTAVSVGIACLGTSEWSWATPVKRTVQPALLEKKSEKIDLSSREPSRAPVTKKLYRPTKSLKNIMILNSDDETDLREHKEFEAKKRQKNVNDDVDSDFFGDTRTAGSRDPSSVEPELSWWQEFKNHILSYIRKLNGTGEDRSD